MVIKETIFSKVGIIWNWHLKMIMASRMMYSLSAKAVQKALGRPLSSCAISSIDHCSRLPYTQLRRYPFSGTSKFARANPLTQWRMFISNWPTRGGMAYKPVSSKTPVHGQMQVRTVTRCSKNKGKRKTVKAVAKRFIRTGSGKLKYWPAGKVHNMLAKSRKKRLHLRKARYVNKTQLKTLNKMITGW